MSQLREDMEALLEGKQVPQITKWVNEYETDDYPYGRERTKATFTIEKRGKRYRVSRVTINPKTGRANKAKKTTYGLAAKLGIGADGRTYIAMFGEYGGISITPGTMKGQIANLYYDDPGFKELFINVMSAKKYELYKKMKERSDKNPRVKVMTPQEIAKRSGGYKGK